MVSLRSDPKIVRIDMGKDKVLVEKVGEKLITRPRLGGHAGGHHH